MNLQTMKTKTIIIFSSLFSLLLSQIAIAQTEIVKQEILVTIDKYQVTADELQETVASSPIAVQFNSMDEKEQASIRGDLLKRLVSAKLLRLEAEKMGLDNTPAYIKDVNGFRLGLLYRFYMDKLRNNIQLSEQDLQQLRLETNGNQDEFNAAKSAYSVEIYRGLRKYTLQKLQEEFKVIFYLSKITPSIKEDTVLMSGDHGLQIVFSDIFNKNNAPQMPSPELIEDRLYKQTELLLIAKAAEREKVDITRRLDNYKVDKLTALLMSKKEKEWVPNEKTLRDYFLAHPKIAIIPERRNIGMIILDTKESAKKIKKRINEGESLFSLAGQFSSDPYGRAHNGDYGWIKEGTGSPEIEAALENLENNKVSDIIQTKKGYHIVVILDRRTGAIRHYAGIKDKIQQQVIDEKMGAYLQQLQAKYKVVWNVIEKSAVKPAPEETN